MESFHEETPKLLVKLTEEFLLKLDLLKCHQNLVFNEHIQDLLKFLSDFFDELKEDLETKVRFYSQRFWEGLKLGFILFHTFNRYLSLQNFHYSFVNTLRSLSKFLLILLTIGIAKSRRISNYGKTMKNL